MDVVGSSYRNWHHRCPGVQCQHSRGTALRHEISRDRALRENAYGCILGQQAQSVADAPGIRGKGSQPAPYCAEGTGAKSVRSRREVDLAGHEMQEEIGIEIIKVIRGQDDWARGGHIVDRKSVV